MPASIFKGNKVKTLKGTLTLNDVVDIVSGSDDPTSVAKDGPAGSLYLRTTGQLYQKQDAGVTTNWTLNNTPLSGGGGGGGGGGAEDPGKIILEMEANSSEEIEGDGEYVDDFEESEKGTLSQMIRIGSKAIVSEDYLSGTIERDGVSDAERSSCSGGLYINLQGIAPNATTITYSAPNWTMVFDGDVTHYFPAAKKIAPVRLYLESEGLSDGEDKQVGSINSTTGLNLLTISSSSFSAGETTVIASAVNADDITFGLVAADYPDKLRMCPFNYTVEVNMADQSPGGGDYEEVTFTRLYSPLETITINGSSYFDALTDAAIVGSVLKIDSRLANDGPFGYMRVIENEGAIDVYHFWYSKDRGASWTYHGSKTSNTDISDESGSSFQSIHNLGIVVQNSGKVICNYVYRGTTAQGMWGVYTNLADTSPVLSDMPAHSGTNSPNTAGAMFYNNTNNFWSGPGASLPNDDSFIAFVVRREGVSTFQVKMWDYSGATPTYLSTSDTGEVGSVIGSDAATSNIGLTVTGSGTSHRTHVFGLDDASGTSLNGRYFAQGSSSPSSYTSISNLDCSTFIGWKSNGSYLVALGSQVTTGYPIFTYLDLTGTTWSSRFYAGPQSSFSTNNYVGWHTPAARNNNRIALNRIAFDPVNGTGKSILVGWDVENAGTSDARHSYLTEIRDITDYQGVHISQLSIPNTLGLRDAAARTQVGQTFTANTSRYRSSGYRIKQIGKIASGQTLVAKIYATAAGIPTGAALYTSNNTVDPSEIIGSGFEWRFFNFDNVSLTNGVVYAEVVEGTYTISGTNYIQFAADNGVPYAGGTAVSYDGSTWTTTATDLAFIKSGDWHEVVGNSRGTSVSEKNILENNSETQVVKSALDRVRLTWSKSFFRYALANDIPITGIPYFRDIVWGTSDAQSDISVIKNIGYDPSDLDENLVFNVSLGSDSACGRDLATGVLSTANAVYERSLLNQAVAGGTYPSRTADVNFQSGYCLDLNGTTHNIQYTDSTAFDLYFDKPFAFEFEINPTNVTSNADIINTTNSSVQGGVRINKRWSSNGDLRIAIYSSAATLLGESITVGGTISAGVVTYVRILGLGDGSAPKIYTSSTYDGTFTEASYSSQTVFASGNTSGISAVFNIGRFASGANFYGGKIGYVKFVNGSSTFAFTGYKENSPIVAHQNLGRMVTGKKYNGDSSTTINSNFGNLGVMNELTALVDSRGMLAKWDHSITGGDEGVYEHLKITQEIPTTADPSSIEAYYSVFV